MHRLALLLVFASFFQTFVASQEGQKIYDNFIQCLSSNHSVSDPDQTDNDANDVSSIIYGPNGPSFTSVLNAYVRNLRCNTSDTPKPGLIVTPLEESHVQATVICAKRVGLELRIRSGGHDYEGVSYISHVPFVILDMFNFRNITINMDDETAWVQAGATLGELYYRIYEKSKVHGFAAGVCPTVGVGGHISGGGYGAMLRKYGLTVDNVLDAIIVDAYGRVMGREAMEEDLFWAIRGGGGASFGVILAFKIKLLPVPEKVSYFRVERGVQDHAIDLVYQWQTVMQTIDNDLFIRLLLQPTGERKNKTVKVSFRSLFLGDASRLLDVMNKGFPQLGIKLSDITETGWINAMLLWANFDNDTAPEVFLKRTGKNIKFGKRKSDYVRTPIPKFGLEYIFEKLAELEKTGLVFNPYGGRMNEIPETDTPFPHRNGTLFKIQYSSSWTEPGLEADNKYMTYIRDLYHYMTPFVTKNPREAYLNYRDLDIGINHWDYNSYEEGQVYGKMYFKGNLDKLMIVKRVVDPNNFFKNEQSIPILPE